MSYIDYFTLPEAYTIDFNYLVKLQPETQHEIKIFGKTQKVPRYQQAYGKDYIFSNAVSHALPVPDKLKPLMDYFSEMYNCNFNALLINWYPDGQYYIGMHSDNEKQIVPESPIITVSFGETRKFVTKEISTSAQTAYQLKHRDVLVMRGTFQKTHKHGIPKQLKVKGMRISVTLRCFI